jgi:predicted TIM-barrel fold metal-dependent hydrolase
VLGADGFAVSTCYNGIYLGDASLNPLWDTLNKREKVVVHVHPDGYQRSVMGRPTVLAELAFDTTSTVIDMLYNGFFRRYPNIIWVIAHCGGALPALSGRLFALGTEVWAPNPNGITVAEMRSQLAALFVDTAATASASLLLPAMEMTGKRGEHIVYGSDCGVPCSTEEAMDENVKRLLDFEGLTGEEKEAIGHRLEELFPAAAERIKEGQLDV